MPIVAASSYSFHRMFVSGEATLERDAARLARACGADAIEFALGGPLSKPLDDELAGALQQQCEAADVPVCSVVVSAELLRGSQDDRRSAVQNVIEQLRAAQRLGASNFRHDATLGPEGGDMSEAAFDRALPILADACHEIADEAGRLGMRSSVENHACFVQAAHRVARLVEAVDHPNFGVTLDIGNGLFADQDHVEAVRRLAPYAITVHVKDFIINPTPEEVPCSYGEDDVWDTYAGGPRVLGCELGEGDVEIDTCVGALLEAGFDGPWVVGSRGPNPARTAVQHGVAYVRRCLDRAVPVVIGEPS